MTASTTQKALNVIDSARTINKLVLLDGRIIQVNMGEAYDICDTDGNNKSLRFDALELRNSLHKSIFTSIKTTLSTHSLSYNIATLYAVKKWLELPQMRARSSIDISELNLLNEIPASYRAIVVPLLRRISALKLPGLTEKVVDFLKYPHRWEERGQGSYYGLITNDPERGAFTEQEIHDIHSQLHRAYSTGGISLTDYAICWFFIGTGVRPSQAHRMKKSDVIVHSREGIEVTLRIPLIKGEKTSSQEFWSRRAPSVLAECLISYLESPTTRARSDDTSLFNCASSGALSIRMVSVIQGLDTLSERLGTRTPITPYRFRYTLGTRALAQGASDYEVARLLTHRSTSCIQYYRASMPELQKPIRDAVGAEMAFFANAFQGKTIRGLNEASRAGDPDAVITDFMRLTGQPVGACGTRAACYQNAPIACLAGCAHFEPLLSAPWEVLMAELVADQELEQEPKIRLVNHSAMSAIRQIIALRKKSEEEI